MKRKTRVIILCVIVFVYMIATIIILNNATPIDDDKYITAANIGEGSLQETISDITLRAPSFSVSANLGAKIEKVKQLQEYSFSLEDEKMDEDGMLINGNVFVNIQNYVLNKSDKPVQIDLLEFYLVLCDSTGKVTRGSNNPRLAYLDAPSEGVELENFTLSLEPLAQASLKIMYIEDVVNLRVPSAAMPSSCYYRVKRNDKILYYPLNSVFL